MSSDPLARYHRRRFRLATPSRIGTGGVFSLRSYITDFSQHGHPGGEEFLVLDGTFQDETGDFPVGTCVGNPPGSAHAPGSKTGCAVFAKLWQFRAGRPTARGSPPARG